MTERNLLIKFCVSSSSNSNSGSQQQQFSAIAADAPTSVRVFGSSNTNGNSETELLYTASAIPQDELLGTGANDSSLIGAHSTINEALTAMNMSSSSSSSHQQHRNEDAAVSNFVKGSFSCDLVMGTSAGRVSLFDCISGHLRWSRFVPDGSNVAVRAVAVSGGFVFAATARHTISVFEASSGRVVFNGASSSVSTSTNNNASSSQQQNVSSAFAATIGTAKSMSAYTNHKDNTIYVIVGGLQPVTYRMSATSSSSSTSKILEPFAFCRVQQAPCDQVTLFEHEGSLLASTCVYSEGIVRIWNLNNNSNNSSSSTNNAGAAGSGAICSHVFDISASNGSAAMTNLHQRFSFVDVSIVDKSSLNVVASTVSGNMFLWNKNLSSSAAFSKESTNSIGPSSTLLSPDNETKSISSSRNNRRVPTSTSSRIISAFFSSNSNNLVIIRRNWSAPIFQGWAWSALVSSSSGENAIAVGGDETLKILPASAAASLSAKDQAKRLIHLPASTAKMSAHAALKGLDLPSAGVHAFPKVNLFRASEVGELPTYQQQKQQAAADEQQEQDGEHQQQSQEEDEDDQDQKISALAAVAKKKRAGVAPALYQALHAEDVPLIMEILNVADRSDADRNATVQSLSLPYIVQLLYLLSKRVIDDGTAKTPLHSWVSSIMQLRGNELFQVIKNNNNSEINPDSLKAALLPLLEHYRGILSSVGNQIAFTAGRASIFKAVKRRAGNVRHKRKQQVARFDDGPRFIDTSKGIIVKTGEEDRNFQLEKHLKKKLKRKAYLKRGKLVGAEGDLVGDDFEDDFNEEEILGEDGAVISSKQQEDKELDEEEGFDNDDQDDEEGFDDDQDDDMEDGDDADLLPGEDEEDFDEENFEGLDDELGPLDEDDEEFGLDEEDDDAGILEDEDEEEGEEEADEGDDEYQGNNDEGSDDSDADDDDEDDDLEEDGVVEHLRSGKKSMKLNSKVQYD